MNDSKLKRNLSFVQMIAISSGAVIGGWLAEAPYWFQTTGAGAAFLFPLLSLLLVPVGLAFGELSAMLPFAAGVDAWTSNAYGNKMGFATQWMMFLIQVVEPPMMAFIFGTAINHFYPLNSDQMMMVAIFSVTLWFVLSNFNISLTGKLSNFFFFSMIVISLLVSSILGILAIVSGLMHAFTTLMGFWTSSARVLYGAAQLNQLPRGFMKVNRYGQPFLANVVVYMFSLFFCFFSGDNWVQYIYAISSIAAGVVYFISCLDVVRLRRLHPEWKRPFRAPGGFPMFLVGMGISIWLVIGACMELDAGGYLSLLLFFGLGVVGVWVAH